MGGGGGVERGRRRLEAEGRERLTDEREAHRAEGVAQGAALTLRICLEKELTVSGKRRESLPR